MSGEIVTSASASHGGDLYIIEWRTKPDSMPLAYDAVKGALPRILTNEWVQYNIDIKQLILVGHGPDIVRPIIADRDQEAGQKAGLMSRLVAEAVVACLRTAWADSIHGMLDSLEWRMVECTWKYSHEARRKEDKVAP